MLKFRKNLHKNPFQKPILMAPENEKKEKKKGKKGPNALPFPYLLDSIQCVDKFLGGCSSVLGVVTRDNDVRAYNQGHVVP